MPEIGWRAISSFIRNIVIVPTHWWYARIHNITSIRSIRNWVKTFQTILVSDSLTTSSKPYLSQRTSITISQKSLLEKMETCSPWAKLWKKVLGNVLLHQTNPQEILEDNFAEPVQLTMYKQPRTELGRVPNKLVYRKWHSAWDSMPLTRQPKIKKRETLTLFWTSIPSSTSQRLDFDLTFELLESRT